MLVDAGAVGVTYGLEVLSNRQACLNVPAPTATLYYSLYLKPGSCPSSHRAFDSLSALRLYNATLFAFQYPLPRQGARR